MLNISGLKLPMIGDILVGGNVYFVDSGSGVANDENDGLHPVNSPLATFAGAFDKCTASNGDIIVLQPGHAETLTASGSFDVAGVTVVGIGNGDNRPTLTVNADSIFGANVTADDIKIHNVRIVAGSSIGVSARLSRVAASDIEFSKCRFEMAYDMYHMHVVVSGDNVVYDGCEFINTVTTSASTHPQAAFINIGGTNVVIKNSRFNDTRANKAERWRTCVEGGALASNLQVEDCTFVCRGIATATRSAGASDGTGYQSPTMATLYCRAISPSANTAVGALFTPTYQYIVESYNVAAVNKVGLVAVTT